MEPGRSRAAVSSADGRAEAEALAAEAVQWGGDDGDPEGDPEGAVSAEAQTAVMADAAVQCEPSADAAAALADPVERHRLLAAPELAAFLSGATARCEEALQQNELADTLVDELAALVDEEGGELAANTSQAASGTASGAAHRVATGLVEHQSFSDLIHSKGRVLSAVHWHPAQGGVLAVACIQPPQDPGAGGAGSGSAAPAQAVGRAAAAAGTAGASKGPQAGQPQAVAPTMASSTGGVQQPPAGCILVWNHGDAIHPQTVLQAPAEVLAFAFNPVQPQWLVAGLATGQVALFNLQEQQQPDTGSTASSAGAAAIAGTLAPAGQQHAKVRAGGLTKCAPSAGAAAAAEGRGEDGRPAALLPIHVSLPEASHQAAVTDLHWMPRAAVSRDGRLEAAAGSEDRSRASTTSDAHFLFATVAADGSLLLWDMRISTRQRKTKDDEGPDWKPVLSLAAASATKQPLPTTCFCLDGRGGPAGGRFLLGSLDGDLAAVDAASYSLEHKGKGEWSHNTVQQVAGHTGRVVALGPSPFFPDLFLVVADNGFTVWHIRDVSAARHSSGGSAGGTTGSVGSSEAGKARASTTDGGGDGGGSMADACLPLFESPFARAMYTCGCWSPTKPGTILVGRADGRLEAWNLLDRTHQDVMVASVSPCALTALAVSLQPSAGGSRATGGSAAQLLAVGDSAGTLRLLELPRALHRRGHAEYEAMAALLQREQERLAAVALRTAQRLAEQRAAADRQRAEAAAAQATGTRKQRPEEGAGRQSEEEGQVCDAAEQRYLQLEALWRQRLLGGGALAVAADA